MAKAAPQFIETTRPSAELLAEAEALSRRLVGCSADEAWTRVQAGEFQGTPFAARMRQVMFLVEESIPAAAE